MTRARWAALLLVLVAVAATVAVVLWPRDDSRDDAQRRAAATAYADALKPILSDGGKVIVLGIRPALTDYSLGKNRPGQLEREAEAWDSALAGIEDRVAGVAAPAFLEPAKAKYLESLAKYRELARRLGAAATVPKAQRDVVVTEVAAIGTAADKIYDEAEAMVAAASAAQ